MLEEKIINAFKCKFYDLLGSLSIHELTQNKALPSILERISKICRRTSEQASMQRDLDLEFSRFCEALSKQEKRRSPTIKRRLIRLKRLAVKLKRCLEKSSASKSVATTK